MQEILWNILSSYKIKRKGCTPQPFTQTQLLMGVYLHDTGSLNIIGVKYFQSIQKLSGFNLIEKIFVLGI